VAGTYSSSESLSIEMVIAGIFQYLLDTALGYLITTSPSRSREVSCGVEGPLLVDIGVP